MTPDPCFSYPGVPVFSRSSLTEDRRFSTLFR
nr:MAG TPA: hypothetical protein [Caudoviricetes sp.]